VLGAEMYQAGRRRGDVPPVPHRLEEVEGDGRFGVLAREVAVEEERLAEAGGAHPDLVVARRSRTSRGRRIGCPDRLARKTPSVVESLR